MGPRHCLRWSLGRSILIWLVLPLLLATPALVTAAQPRDPSADVELTAVPDKIQVPIR
jgi:hypothetical protein